MRGRTSFVELRRNGVRGRSGPISVAFAPGGADAPAQVGYAISRQVGNAVVRNRLRRRLRGALSDLTRTDPATLGGGLYLITPRAGAVSLPFPELAHTLGDALHKAVRRALPGVSR